MGELQKIFSQSSEYVALAQSRFRVENIPHKNKSYQIKNG